MNIAREIAGLVLVSVLLAGCTQAPSEPTVATSAAEPTPAPTLVEEPAVTSIVIEGDRFLTVLDNGAIRDTVLFSSDPAVASALFREIFAAEPVVEDFPTTHCAEGATRASWDELGFLVISNTAWLPPGQLFQLIVHSAVVGNVEVMATGGYQVGDPAASLIASMPPTSIEAYPVSEGIARIVVFNDIEGGDADVNHDLWGSRIGVADGLIEVISSPDAYLIEGNC